MTANPYLKLAEARVGVLARKWTLDRLLDVGGMAAVYAASHRNGNRVAVKVLHPQFGAMPEVKERFLKEGYVANKVGHDGAVTVLDDDELDDGTPFLVMELLEGQSLEGRVRLQRVLSAAETFYVADQVLDVLAAAHRQGIIHRDIKPANLFLTGAGVVKVLDFGLARLQDGNNFIQTRPGAVLGTTSYMSPEQARGRRENIDHRTDVFAVGAVMFRALTGRTVHVEKNQNDLLLAAMKNHAPPVVSLVPQLPAAVAAVIDRALAYDKEARFPDAHTMQSELRAVYQQHQGAPLPPVGKSAKWVAQWLVPIAQPDKRADDIHVSIDIDGPSED